MKKVKLSTIQNKLWKLCKLIVRNRYVKDDGTWDCFTCKKPITKLKNAHTAHFIPSASCGVYLRFDLDNLRVCCYHCNINLGGYGAMFYRNLLEEKGKKYVDNIFKKIVMNVKVGDEYYENKIREYEEIYLREM